MAFTEMLGAQSKPNVSLSPYDLADYVQVTNDIPDATQPYWTDPGGAAGKCDYSTCFTAFGPTDTPTLLTTRDLRIYEAYQDHLELEPRTKGQDLNQLLCCFPGALSFNVRVGNQWAVLGDQSGFIHHVVADATTGQCRNACDPALARKNARLVETAPALVAVPVPDRGATDIDPSPSFQNPMFRFAILTGKQKCASDVDCGSKANCNAGFCAKTGGAPVTVPTQRDSVFRFTTNGSFAPLLIGLATDGTSLIEPQSITYLPPTMELAVIDGAFNGLIMVSLQTSTVTRSFF
jgi:hypothetical protein